MRLIDADALKELIESGDDLNFDDVPETKAELLRMIDDSPTVVTEYQNLNNGQTIYNPNISNTPIFT